MNLERDDEVKNWQEQAETKMAELEELVEMELFQPGEKYGIEQFLDDPEDWYTISEMEIREVVKGVGEHLGVDLTNYKPEDVFRAYHEDGVPESRTEAGGEVDVLKTNQPGWEVHVVRYYNRDVGNRFDIVRSDE